MDSVIAQSSPCQGLPGTGQEASAGGSLEQHRHTAGCCTHENPSTPSHYGAHSCAPSFQSPGQSVSHPPAWGPACTVETVTQAAPANSSTSTAGDVRLSLTNCLCRCVLLGRSLKRWLSTQHREQEKTVQLLLQARYFFLYQ